jgi:predicted ATP-grasp superfamily ATP-dependent carboligase
MDDSGDTAWFLKPTDSQAFRGRFGAKALRVASREQAATLLQEIQRAELDVVLQEYVPGGADCHYFLDGFVDRGGAVRALFARRRVRMWPPDFGDSSFMRSVPADETASAGESLRRLLSGVGHRGIFSAEFKRDPRDGEFRLIEVNVRPWAYVEFTTSCGLNTPWMAYLDALGRDVPEVGDYPVGRAGGVLGKDYRSFLALRRQGRLGLKEWVRSWWPARDLIFRWDDPLPGLAQVLKGRR